MEIVEKPVLPGPGVKLATEITIAGVGEFLRTTGVSVVMLRLYQACAAVELPHTPANTRAIAAKVESIFLSLIAEKVPS